ncbi:MAG: outer membrane protein assembly factor BamB family protein [bacterium]
MKFNLSKLWLSTGIMLLTSFIVSGCPKPPMVPEKPNGSVLGYKNVAFTCSTRTTDPSGDKVAYQFDWGDGSQSGWSGWFDGNVFCADTHTYTVAASYEIRARAKNSRGRVSGWSEPLIVEISPGEGEVRWRFTYTDTEQPEDSADFSNHIFSIGPEGNVYIPAGDIPALMCRNPIGNRRWEFIPEDDDELSIGATIAPDGTIYFGTEDGNLYALNPNGVKKWKVTFRSGITSVPALGADGTIYIQTENDSAFALNPENGSKKWSFYAGGGEHSPVVGPDGTIFVAQDDTLFALDPATGQAKWRYGMRQAIGNTPAIDTRRSVVYVVDEDGWLASVNLSDGRENWSVRFVGELSAPVIGEDGTIYITLSGTLLSLIPENGDIRWQFIPPMMGDASTPAVTNGGVIYFLCVGLTDQGEERDSLYAVNSDGNRRWAAGLGIGTPAEFISAPKIDDAGYVYIGDGTRAWCVVGFGGPANSSWPMFGADIRNSHRAE